MRRQNSLDQMFRQMFAPPPPPPPTETSSTRVALHTLEEFMYQYNRNMREYNQNIRQLSHQLDYLTRDLSRSSPPAAPFPQYTFSFSVESEQDSAALTETELMERLRMTVYDASASTVCPISLERFQQGDAVCEIVGCGHKFKRDPALQWLRRNPVCPVCRYDLRMAETIPPPPPPPPQPSVAGIAMDLFRRVLSDASGGAYEFELPLEMLTTRRRTTRQPPGEEISDADVD
jgi:hypothetical protein